MMTSNLIFNCRVIAGILTLAALGSATPITLNDSSNLFLNFDGSGGTPVQLIDDLTAQLHLYGFSFSTATGTHAGQTRVAFSFDLANTSTSPVLTSRISGLGFNTTPNLINTIDNLVSGVFDTVLLSPNFQNGIGTVEFCFTAQNCPGGGGGGVEQGDTSTGNTAVLYFSGNVSQISLDNAYVRYQSVSCEEGTTCPPSATGTTTDDPPMPEPSTYLLLTIGLASFLGARRMNWIR